MNWLQLIQRRNSTRYYQPTLPEFKIAQARKYCHNAKGYDGTPVSLHLLPGFEVSRGRKSLTIAKSVSAPWYLGAVAPNQREALVNLGYGCQQVVLYLTALGLGSCWLATGFDGEALGSSLGLGKGLAVRAIIAFGEKTATSEKGGRRRRPERIAYFPGVTGDSPFPSKTIIEAVRWAPSALNRQPWRLWFDVDAIHLYSKSGRLAPSLIPIEIGIALCHLVLACKELGVPGSLLQREHPIHKAWEYWLSYQFD